MWVFSRLGRSYRPQRDGGFAAQRSLERGIAPGPEGIRMADSAGVCAIPRSARLSLGRDSGRSPGEAVTVGDAYVGLSVPRRRKERAL